MVCKIGLLLECNLDTKKTGAGSEIYLKITLYGIH
jgi:hypothetical protein